MEITGQLPLSSRASVEKDQKELPKRLCSAVYQSVTKWPFAEVKQAAEKDGDVSQRFSRCRSCTTGGDLVLVPSTILVLASVQQWKTSDTPKVCTECKGKDRLCKEPLHSPAVPDAGEQIQCNELRWSY